jgi:hypothetical protein
MHRRLLMLVVALVAVGSLAFAQDLKIESVLELAQTAKGNDFSFTGPIRSMAVDKDHIDAATGASVKNSTELFQSCLAWTTTSPSPRPKAASSRCATCTAAPPTSS